MGNKSFFTLLMLIIVSSIILSGCLENTGTNVTAETNSSSDVEVEESTIQRIEVFHFHGTHQCYSCKTVGAYAEETINTYFSDELASEKIIFGHINGELPENKDLVTKYGVSTASLWIGVYHDNGFHKEENVNVWYKINDKQEYMRYLEGLIEKRLAGDFS